MHSAIFVHYNGQMTTIISTSAFDDWFNSLRDREAKQRISVRIRRLGSGNPGQHRTLKGCVSEMKIDYGPGYRIYYTERLGITYILLCGGDKRTQDADIEIAVRMAKEL